MPTCAKNPWLEISNEDDEQRHAAAAPALGVVVNRVMVEPQSQFRQRGSVGMTRR